MDQGLACLRWLALVALGCQHGVPAQPHFFAHAARASSVAGTPDFASDPSSHLVTPESPERFKDFYVVARGKTGSGPWNFTVQPLAGRIFVTACVRKELMGCVEPRMAELVDDRWVLLDTRRYFAGLPNITAIDFDDYPESPLHGVTAETDEIPDRCIRFDTDPGRPLYGVTAETEVIPGRNSDLSSPPPECIEAICRANNHVGCRSIEALRGAWPNNAWAFVTEGLSTINDHYFALYHWEINRWQQRRSLSPLNELRGQSPWNMGMAIVISPNTPQFTPEKTELHYVDSKGDRLLHTWEFPYNTSFATKIAAGNGVLWAAFDTHTTRETLEVWRWVNPLDKPDVYHLDCKKWLGHECGITGIAAGEELSLWMNDYRVEWGDDQVVRRIKLRRDPDGWHVDATDSGQRITDRAPRDGKMRVPEATPYLDILDEPHQASLSRVWYRTDTYLIAEMAQETILLSDRPTTNVWELGAVTVEEPPRRPCP